MLEELLKNGQWSFLQQFTLGYCCEDDINIQAGERIELTGQYHDEQ
jgi:hypothetical protein